MADYELRLTTDAGSSIGLLTAESFAWSVALHDVGVFTATLNPEWASLLDYDRRIDVWRAEGSVEGGLMRSYPIRIIEDSTDEQGKRSLQVTGFDGNYLLAGGLIEYAAGSAQAEITDYADDMCKAVVRNCLGASAPEPLDSTLFSVAADLSVGPSFTKAFAWRNVLDVLRDIAEEADGAGTPIYWHVFDLPSTSGFEFRTATNQLGRDRSHTSAHPLVLGVDRGNLKWASLTRDASEEVNHAFAGGAGEETARLIGEATSANATASKWSRRRGFVDATNLTAQASVTNAAGREVIKRTRRNRFECAINSTPGARLGLDWGFGDRLTAEYQGAYYTGMVRALKVTVDTSGQESVDAKIQVT